MKKIILFSAFLICLSLTLGCNGTTSDAQPASSSVNVSVKETEKSVVVPQNKTESVSVANEVTPVSVNNAISEDLSKYLDRACAKDLSKELKNPIAVLTKAAEAGDMKAQYLLAECYFHGEGTDENFVKAAFWFQKAADQDYIPAQKMLAFCYIDGNGVPKNPEEATKWLLKAVVDGDNAILSEIWIMARNYALGDGVAKNKEKSIELLDILNTKSIGFKKDLFYANKLVLLGKFEAAHIAFQRAIQQFESAPFSQSASAGDFSEMLSGYRLLYFWYLVSFAEGYSPESKNYDYICLGDENIQSNLSFFWVTIDDFKMNRNSEFYEFGQYLKKTHEIIAKHFGHIIKPHMNCPLWSDKERPEINWPKLSEDFKNFLSEQYFRSENVEWSAVIKLYQKLQADFQASQQKLLSIIDREKLSSSSSITIDQSLEYVKSIEIARLWVSLNDKALRFYLFDTPVLFFTTMSMGPVNHAVGTFNYFNDTDLIMAVAKPFSVLTTPALPYTSENYVRELWFMAAKDIKKSLSENDYKELQNLTTKVLPAINLPENFKFHWP